MTILDSDRMCLADLRSASVNDIEGQLHMLAAHREAAVAEVELRNTAEWATLMADVHDYFADERADRGHGRVRLVLTLLGQLRCERDAWRNVADLFYAETEMFSTHPGSKAYEALVAGKPAVKQLASESIPSKWQPAASAPVENTRVVAMYRGVNIGRSGFIENKRFWPDGQHGSEPFTHWIPIPSFHNNPANEHQT